MTKVASLVLAVLAALSACGPDGDAAPAYTTEGSVRCCAEGTGTACCGDAPAGRCFQYMGVHGVCRQAGERLDGKTWCEHCCEGLSRVSLDGPGDEIPPAVDGRPDGCDLTHPVATGVCILCGDGVCGAAENFCNCPGDCPRPDAGPKDDASRVEACSTGAPYTLDAGFAELDHEPSADTPECTLRCGDKATGIYGAGGTAPLVTALPVGACAIEGNVCRRAAVYPYACNSQAPGRQGTLMQYECTCRSGTWVCAGRYLGGGAHSCEDAGF